MNNNIKRQLTVGMLKNRIDAANERGDKVLTITVKDAEWMMEALVHNWKKDK